MHSDLHRKLLRKMVLGGIMLSLVIGTIVVIAEMERVDHYVVNLAQNDSARLTEAFHNYHLNPSADNKARLDEMAYNSVHEQHFIFVEVYNARKEKVVEKALERIEPIINQLEKKQHTFLMTDKVDYIRFFFNKRLYQKIIAPIFNDEDAPGIIGYFEGIYLVSGERVKEISLWLAGSILQVVLTISLTSLILYPVIIGLNKDLIRRSMDLSDANLGMLKVLGSAVAKRDSDTNAHNFRVTIYAIRLAEEIGMPRQDIQALTKGAFLHDLGKIGISDTILLKPAKLTAEEFETMKEHVRHGVDIIKHYIWLDDAVDVVRFHHEKFDGSGYLKGLQGEEIPLNARIFAIADVFDALTSKRPYKEPFSFEQSAAIIEEGIGAHFDPELAAAFLKIARPLYDQLSGNEEESYLNSYLDQLISAYFSEKV